MINLRPQDAIHKSYLNRILIEVIDNPILSQNLAFKGGTCASMLGFLDRFSIDLDFDLITDFDKKIIRKEFRQVFKKLDLNIAMEYTNVIFFLVKYPSAIPNQRNSIKISLNDVKIKSNEYKVQFFPEIDRLMNSQTIEAMFANKLVAATDRYRRFHTIAGRDIYDIHHFYTRGYKYKSEIIKERTGLTSSVYLNKLIEFIKEHVNQKIVDEDLNTLLPNDYFQQIRKILIPETLFFLSEDKTNKI